jgi:hypothetical protein
MSDHIWLYFLAPIIATVIVAIFTSMNSQAQVSNLSAKFVSLGNMKGKTYEEIVEVVGPPNSNSVTGGIRICVWMTKITPGVPTYTISLVFRDGVCERLSENTTAV